MRIGSAMVLGYRNNDLETFYATNHDLLKLDCKRPPANRESSEIYTLLEVRGTTDFGQSLGWNIFELTTFEFEKNSSDLSCGTDWISNSWLKVETEETGQIRLRDLATGQGYGNLFWFEDSADIGDSYDYQPLKDEFELTSFGKNRLSAKTANVGSEARLTLTVRMDIPLKSTEKGRDVPTAPHDIELILTLRPNEKVLYARINFVNHSINHRLRVGFRFMEEPKLFSGGHFTAIERPFGNRGDLFPCRPMTDYLHLGFSRGGLGILTKGLYEFEPRQTPQGSEIYVTLCRSTKSLGPGAGCNYPVDHTKELREHELELALVPSQSLSDTIRQALAYTVPLVGEVLSVNERSKIGPLLSLDNPDVILSAVKRAEDRQGYVVRLFNPMEENQQAVLELHLPYRKVERVELSEEIASKGGYSLSGAGISVSLDSHEVMTLKFWTS